MSGNGQPRTGLDKTLCMNSQLSSVANRLAGILRSSNSEKIVFAESCTAGLVSATMAGVPGISDYLCGSFVTYRESAKQSMLGISPAELEHHTAVSKVVSESMARNSLERMEEATWSAAITGHLGPGAPVELDGKVFVAIACQTR